MASPHLSPHCSPGPGANTDTAVEDEDVLVCLPGVVQARLPVPQSTAVSPEQTPESIFSQQEIESARTSLMLQFAPSCCIDLAARGYGKFRGSQEEMFSRHGRDPAGSVSPEPEPGGPSTRYPSTLGPCFAPGCSPAVGPQCRLVGTERLLSG